MQFLPREQEAAGWRLEKDPVIYLPAQLRTYMDRDAIHFLRYGVVDVALGEYRSVQGDGFAVAEIFRFPDFVKGFGAYSTRRKAVVAFLDIPNESFAGPHSIHVWRGPFYIRVTGRAADARQTLPALQQLAAKIAERMPPAPRKPAVFNFFPDINRIPNSEMFSAEPAFGQPYFPNAFLVSFNVDGTVIEGMVLPTAGKKVAETLLNRYKSFYTSNGRLLDPIPNLGEDNMTAEDRYAGRSVAFRLDRFVIAYRSWGERQKLSDIAITTHDRILGTIRKHLQTADKVREQNLSQSSQPPQSFDPPPGQVPPNATPWEQSAPLSTTAPPGRP